MSDEAHQLNVLGMKETHDYEVAIHVVCAKKLRSATLIVSKSDFTGASVFCPCCGNPLSFENLRGAYNE